MNTNPDMDPTGHMPAGPDNYYKRCDTHYTPIGSPNPEMKDREYRLLTTTDGGYSFQVDFDDLMKKGWIPFPESLNTNGSCYSILLWREKK